MDQSLYDSFRPLYISHLENSLSESTRINISQLNNLKEEDFNFENMSVASVFLNNSLSHMQALNVKLEIGRNLKNYPFAALLDFGYANKMKQEIAYATKKSFKNFSLVEKNYICTSIPTNLFPDMFEKGEHKDQDYYVIFPEHER